MRKQKFIKINLVFIVYILLSPSCKERNSNSFIAQYFERNKWSYPIHNSLSFPLKFIESIDDNEISRISYDTLPLLDKKESFLSQTNEYFKNTLIIDTSTGYVLEKPIIFKSSDNSIIYSIGVKKYVLNFKNQVMPCEGCQSIENNRIFLSANRALFEIKKDSVLEFKNWMN